MKFASIFAVALLGILPVIADEPTVESLTRRIEVLEQKVAALSAQVSGDCGTFLMRRQKHVTDKLRHPTAINLQTEFKVPFRCGCAHQ